MKNKLILILFLSLFLIIISINLLTKQSKPSTNNPTQDEEQANVPLDKFNLLLTDLETETGKIEVKAGILNETKNQFVGIVVSYNNKVKLYNWRNAIETAFLPILHFEDINNDGIKEIIINSTLKHGTGILINEIHVLNSNDLSEYKVDSISEFIIKNIKTRIDDKLYIIINGKEEIINIDILKEDKSISLFKEASFDNIIEYVLVDKQIKAIVPVQVSDKEYFGNLIFMFDMKNNTLNITDVYYDKYITDISQLSFKYENYFYEEFPLISDDRNFKDIDSVTIDNISKVFYTKDDSGEIFSYLNIDDKKYDLGSFYNSDINNISKSFEKTDILVNGLQLYKCNIPQGANLNDVVYFQIIDNKPVILMKLENSYEFFNNNEIMTYYTHGLINSTTFIYRWADYGLYISDLNTLFNEESVMFNSNLKEIYFIIKHNLDNPRITRVKKLTLDGINVY